jgi:hypothetical protein
LAEQSGVMSPTGAEAADFHDRLYEREDWTGFRSLGTLSQKAGVAVSELRRLVVKELVDNALDALEEAGGTLVSTCVAGVDEDGSYYVEDGGPGLPPEHVAALFSIKRPAASSKLRRLPSRGCLGNGLRVVTGAVLASGGRLEVWTRNQHLRLRPQDDGETLVEMEAADYPVGIKVSVWLGPSIPADPDALAWADAAMTMFGGERYRGLPSGWWYDSDSFYELLQASRRSVRDEVGAMDGCTGAKAGRISAEYKGRGARSLMREEADRLLWAIRSQVRPVKPERLGAVGDDLYPAGVYERLRGTFRRPPGRGRHAAEIPCLIECWAAPAVGEPGEASEDLLDVTVNRTAITSELVYWRYVKKKSLLVVNVGGIQLQIEAGPAPLRLHLNITAPHIPITTDGKEPDLSPFRTDLQELASRAARKARRRGSGSVERDGPRTQKDVILTYLQEGIARASGGGAHAFGERQLFYSIRPFVKRLLGKELQQGTFDKVIAEYERAQGKIPGLYREARGLLYHPHLHITIPLGTREIADYERPEWNFNKVVYIEKEGLFEVLIAEAWPERHDCALLTSKGFASGAARDLLDMLAETAEPLFFYCVHDADAYGTMIYQTLQEETRARPGRPVLVVNLGLELWEAEDMGLEIEPAESSGKARKPVADYVYEQGGAVYAARLQRERVELNEMPTPDFIAWMDAKLAGEIRKVVPPVEVQAARLRSETEERLRNLIRDRLLAACGFEEVVAQALLRLDDDFALAEQDLDGSIRSRPADDEAAPWTTPVEERAEQLALADDAAQEEAGVYDELAALVEVWEGADDVAPE